jgi:hypothetical protein
MGRTPPTTISDDNNVFTEPATGDVTSAAPVYCGGYLEVPQSAVNPQILGTGTKFGTTSFVLALAYRASYDGTFVALTSAAQNGGFTLGLSNGALVLTFTSTVPVEVFRDQVTTADKQWHTVEVTVTTNKGVSTLAVKRDNTTMLTGSPPTYAGLGVALSVGPIDGIDAIAWYAH